nr:hypothetical protein [Tanacetum cinerariifolium]
VRVAQRGQGPAAPPGVRLLDRRRCGGARPGRRRAHRPGQLRPALQRRLSGQNQGRAQD